MKKTTYKNQFRIIGGKWRGRKLTFLPHKDLRPTPNRVRETLFNWLSPVISTSYCLDLFAGSGALGFEALSRGANKVVFVDHEIKAISQIEANLLLLNCNTAKTYCMRAENYIAYSQLKFDIVFLDPPFHHNLIPKIAKILNEASILQPKSYIYFESEINNKNLFLPLNWNITHQKQAGQVLYTLIQTF